MAFAFCTWRWWYRDGILQSMYCELLYLTVGVMQAQSKLGRSCNAAQCEQLLQCKVIIGSDCGTYQWQSHSLLKMYDVYRLE